jgi:hypothetical protein
MTGLVLRRCALFLLLAGAAPVFAQKESPPPNIIFILADDVSACELSPYGGPIAMPNLQKLADEGVLFRQAWSTPLCGPSRAMIMTGKYPHHTGYYENQIWPEVPFWEDPRHLPLLKMMKQAGYDTSMIGKKHYGDDPAAGPLGAADSLIVRYWDGYDGPARRLVCRAGEIRPPQEFAPARAVMLAVSARLRGCGLARLSPHVGKSGGLRVLPGAWTESRAVGLNRNVQSLDRSVHCRRTVIPAFCHHCGVHFAQTPSLP